MEKDKLQNRSERIPQNSNSVEEFTVQDYHDSRDFEVVLDIIGAQYDLPIDTHTQPDDIELKPALENLGLILDTNTEKEIVMLLHKANSFCQYVSFGLGMYMTPEEKQSVSPEFGRENVQVKPFFQQIKYIMSRFITERHDMIKTKKIFGDSSTEIYRQAMIECGEMLGGLYEEVRNIYDVHIPAYDVVFNRFDDLHNEDDDTLEVYLGRDGMHAYYGRIGQLAARGDIELEVPEIDAPSPDRIVYLVYNRTIKDTFGFASYDRVGYLRQFIADTESPHFFDTGYRGSIPEDIINRLGIPGFVDERIHLIDVYNGFENRRVRGLNYNINGSLIEDAPKPEATADGIKQCDEDGTIKYIAKPTSLQEQFRYLVGRTVLIRHYWIKEHYRIKKELAEITTK